MLVIVIETRIGFHPSVYYVSEDAGNVSICARVYESTGTIQDINVTMRTSSESNIVHGKTC